MKYSETKNVNCDGIGAEIYLPAATTISNYTVGEEYTNLTEMEII